ncbi:hypothetical protein DPV78_005294 [Talaromyces pinophilus]|nr:hypothetical protein DPV78_005294 [Talaromyces pinophilus]
MIESPYKLDIPVTDVASFVFNSGTPISRQAPHFDAANPSKCSSLSEAEVFVKQVAKGLEALGLQPDDKVLFCRSYHTRGPTSHAFIGFDTASSLAEPGCNDTCLTSSMGSLSPEFGSLTMDNIGNAMYTLELFGFRSFLP